MKNKISVIIPTYNEEKRIETCLKSIPSTFDEIIVFDKGSTDNTLEIISRYKLIKVISIPYSNRGKENPSMIFPHAKNEWVFIITASEILSENIFHIINQAINKNPEIELIMIPREMYVFQTYLKESPWGIQYYPFCFQKSKIKFSENVHELFYIENEEKKHFLTLSEETLVKHITHNSFNKYFSHIEDYIENEFEKYKDTSDAIQKCKDQILMYDNLFKSNSVNKTIHFAAWSIYWNSIILRLLESKHNLNFEKTDYSEFIDFLEKKKDYSSKLIKPSNFIIIYLKKLYRKYYSIKWLRLLKAKIIKT